METYRTIADFIETNNLRETEQTFIYFEVFECKLFGDKHIFIPNSDYYYLNEEEEEAINSITENKEDVCIQDIKGTIISLGYNI